MKYNELKITTHLNVPIHFQKAPEAISKLISTALINSGYKKHDSKEVKPYVFSNLGKAQKNGFFEKKGSFYLRSFDKDLISRFINTIAEITFQIAKKHKKTVILSGGVFQNKTLLNLILEKLKQENIKTYFNSEIPINDGGLAVGQIGYFLNNF